MEDNDLDTRVGDINARVSELEWRTAIANSPSDAFTQGPRHALHSITGIDVISYAHLPDDEPASPTSLYYLHGNNERTIDAAIVAPPDRAWTRLVTIPTIDWASLPPRNTHARQQLLRLGHEPGTPAQLLHRLTRPTTINRLGILDGWLLNTSLSLLPADEAASILVINAVTLGPATATRLAAVRTLADNWTNRRDPLTWIHANRPDIPHHRRRPTAITLAAYPPDQWATLADHVITPTDHPLPANTRIRHALLGTCTVIDYPYADDMNYRFLHVRFDGTPDRPEHTATLAVDHRLTHA
jgi:hypothetical protein